jgi:hypothetical protein
MSLALPSNPPVSDAQRVAKMVAAMAELLGVTASPTRIRGYVEALADVPVDIVREAIRRASQVWRYPDMPKPADIRAAADAARRATVPEDIADVPYQAGHVCARCEDNGWVCVAERTDRAQPVVKRCPCYQTNSRLVQPKRFSPEEGRR